MIVVMCTVSGAASEVDRNKATYIETLREAVAIRSVSAWPHTRPDIDVMVEWTAKRLKALGATIELVDIGRQTLPDGSTIPLPKVLFGQLGTVSNHTHTYAHTHAPSHEI